MSHTLPPVIQAFIEATNRFDRAAWAETLTDDALVNDAEREFWGKPAALAWADRELFDDEVTMEVTMVHEHHGTFVVAAKMDGLYDKTNLPDPLVLTFYFTLSGDRIAQLFIMFNKPAVLRPARAK